MSSAVKILIVDDEPDICYFLTDNFSRRGFATSFANTIRDAEEQLAANPPDILLLDNHLPDGKGVDMLGPIKLKYPSLKVVMITAHDSSADRQKAYNNEIDFFLSKPFTMTGVNHVVDIILGEK